MSQPTGDVEKDARLDVAGENEPREGEANGSAPDAGAEAEAADQPTPGTPTRREDEAADTAEEPAAESDQDAASSDEQEAEEPSAEAAEENEAVGDDEEADDAGPLADYEDSLRVLTPGEIVEGKVVQVGDNEVLVDVGYKSEGRIPFNEIGLRAGESPRDILNEGDDIAVQVLKVEDAEGNVLLSRKRAQYRDAWRNLEQMYEQGEPVEAVVTERVKGGLLVDVGVRGFVPASHVDRNYVENLDQYVGQTLRMRILELDRQRNNVVLSRRELLEEEYKKAKEETFATLKEGEIVDGTVRRLADFGAFVDIGSGVEGLLHVSELAWSRVRHPSDVLTEGQEIQVKVLNVDREAERISLSLKDTLPDPWESIEERYQVGDILEGEVTRVVDFGAFVKLEDGVEGLVHISQMADHHVTNPSEIVSPGATVGVKVVSLDAQARRIGLSIREAQRQANPAKPASSGDDAYRAGGDDTGHDPVTIGELHGGLGDLFERMQAEEQNNEGSKG